MRRQHPRRLTGILLAVIGGSGCVAESCEPPCSPEIDSAGASYRVPMFGYTTTLDQSRGLGTSYPASTGSCAASDGLGPGASLVLKTQGLADREACKVDVAEIVEAPAQITLVGPSTNAAAIEIAQSKTDVMYAVEEVEVGGCPGQLILDFFNARDIFATPNDSGFPPAVMYRLFLPSGGGCPICDDNFEVNLEKQ